MSGIFYTGQLRKGSSTGQGPLKDVVEAYFPELQVFATISLSMYRTFAFTIPTRYWNAEAYIGPAIAIPPSTVYERTGHLTFTLEVVSAQACAVFSIYDYDLQAARSEMAKPEHRLDLAVYDEVGNVVGTHGVVQLPGGAKIDEDVVSERVLAGARARIEDRTLDVAVIDTAAIPEGHDFPDRSVDPQASASRVRLAFELERRQAGDFRVSSSAGSFRHVRT